MNRHISIVFLVLILLQGLHSIEEYAGHLWEVLAPAGYISGLVSEDPARGFLIVNVLLFLAGVACWIYISRNRSAAAYFILWIWVVIEFINGIGHPLLAIRNKAYFPGLFTSILLLAATLSLAWLLVQQKETNA